MVIKWNFHIQRWYVSKYQLLRCSGGKGYCFQFQRVWEHQFQRSWEHLMDHYGKQNAGIDGPLCDPAGVFLYLFQNNVRLVANQFWKSIQNILSVSVFVLNCLHRTSASSTGLIKDVGLMETSEFLWRTA